MTTERCPLQTFDEWWQEFRRAAREECWRIGEQSEYREYYEEGDTPEAALADEMEWAEAASDGEAYYDA